MTLTWKQIIAASVVLLLVVAAFAVKAVWFPRVDDEWFQLDDEKLANAPARVLILRPTHFANSRRSGSFAMSPGSGFGRRDPSNVRMVGRNMSLTQVMAMAYQCSERDVVLPPGATTNRYDALVTVSKQPVERFRAAVKQQLGYTATRREHDDEVLLLKLVTPNADGLRPSTNSSHGGSTYKAGKLQMRHQPVQSVLYMIEETCKKPVRDKTGLTGYYDFDLEWRRSGGDEPMTEESLRRSLGALGLTLATDTEVMPMMVVERVKK